MTRTLVWLPILLAIAVASASAADDKSQVTQTLKVGTFDVDASPPVGSPLAYDPTKEVTTPLHSKGVVILGADQPIVLCAVDWIGISNGAQVAFRQALADAVGTVPARVQVHALHQHDAPRCDFTIARMLEEAGADAGEVYDVPLARDLIARTAEAAAKAAREARPVNRLGLGEGEVKEVASNRRILGPNGKVQHVRYTACRDPEIRAFPEGTIDPILKMVSFWNDDEPVAVLTYYATHPQSYYRTGGANPDFPGIAREARQEATGVPHIHFNGAGGNIGAGKYNDGSHENRQILADRVAEGMALAWESTKKQPITASDLTWKAVDVALPPAENLDKDELRKRLNDESVATRLRGSAARALIWLDRWESGQKIDVSCLGLGPARVLFMPGELFVEYQLAAQKMRPDLFVTMAAYGEYAPGYIGTAEAYDQGGYETQPGVSLVSPETEAILTDAMKTLLKD